MTITLLPHPAPATPSIDDGRVEVLTLDEALILNRVTEHAWRVCDSRHAPHSPGYLLGFVEETTNGVELMQLGDKFIWTGFPTMRDALTHVVNTAYITATQRAAGDLAWLS
jgi:hypothetical protein